LSSNVIFNCKSDDYSIFFKYYISENPHFVFWKIY
jgi:hypothetical protein